MSRDEHPLGNHPSAAGRPNDVESITTLLFTISLVLSLGLGALAAGTRVGRTLARRHER